MLVPFRALNRRHLATDKYARGAERKRRRTEEEELQEISERAFQAYGAPLENVTAFIVSLFDRVGLRKNVRKTVGMVCHPYQLSSGKVPSVQSTKGYQHVASGSQWVGEVSLLQNYHSISDMPMQKMYPHRHPCRRSSRTALNWSAPRASCGQEFHPLRPWLLTKGRVYPTPSLLCCLPMLFPHVPRHRPKRHLLPAILTLHPSLLSLSVGRALSRHLSPVRHL